MPSGKSDSGEQLGGGQSTGGEVVNTGGYPGTAKVAAALEAQAAAIQKETAAINAAAAAKQKQAGSVAGVAQAQGMSTAAVAAARKMAAAPAAAQPPKATARSVANLQMKQQQQQMLQQQQARGVARPRGQGAAVAPVAQQVQDLRKSQTSSLVRAAVQAWTIGKAKDLATQAIATASGLTGQGGVGSQQDYFEKNLADTGSALGTPADVARGLKQTAKKLHEGALNFFSGGGFNKLQKALGLEN